MATDNQVTEKKDFRGPPATSFRCEIGSDFLRPRPPSILLKGFIRFVDNAEMGETSFIFRNEVIEGALHYRKKKRTAS